MHRTTRVEGATCSCERGDRGRESTTARVHVRLDRRRLDCLVREVEVVLRLAHALPQLVEPALEHQPLLLRNLRLRLVSGQRGAVAREILVGLVALGQQLQPEVEREREGRRRRDRLRVDGGGRRARGRPRGGRRLLRRLVRRGRGAGGRRGRGRRECGRGRDQARDQRENERDCTPPASMHPSCSRHLGTASSGDSGVSRRPFRDLGSPSSAGPRSRAGPCRPGCLPASRARARRGCSS